MYMLVQRFSLKPAYQERHCDRYVENSSCPFETRKYSGFSTKGHHIAVANHRERYEAEIKQLGLTISWVTSNLD